MSQFGEVYNVAEQTCPACHKVVNAATHANRDRYDENIAPKAPSATDICFFVCLYCGEILILADRLRRPTLAEWREVLDDHKFFAELKALQRQVVTFNSLRRFGIDPFDQDQRPN